MSPERMLPKEIIDMLRTYAEESNPEDMLGDDTGVDDLCGGNFDDAFSSGATAGRVGLARDLCDALGISYTAPDGDEDEE